MSTLVISELFPPRVGGTATWFYEVYRRYPPGSVIILTNYEPGDEVPGTGLPFLVLRVPMKIADWGLLQPRAAQQYFRLTRIARRLVREHGIRVVHCGRVIPEGVVGYLLCRLARVHYCVYAHGEEIGIAGSSRQLTVLMRRVYGNARFVIANSENTRRLLREAGVPDSRIVVIRPGVDTDRFCPTSSATPVRERLGLNGHKVILTVGRLQKRKGHDTVIKSLAMLKSAMPDVRYLIAGSGEEDATLRALAAEQGVARLVEFAGHVPQDSLPDYYRACDVFVLPNREEANHDIEGFGIVFLEAGASAKPVIAGRSGGASEAVVDGETGVLVDGEDPSAVANAIVSLLSDSDRSHRMGRRARARAVEGFGWDTVAEQTQRLLAGHGQ